MALEGGGHPGLCTPLALRPRPHPMCAFWIRFMAEISHLLNIKQHTPALDMEEWTRIHEDMNTLVHKSIPLFEIFYCLQKQGLDEYRMMNSHIFHSYRFICGHVTLLYTSKHRNLL